MNLQNDVRTLMQKKMDRRDFIKHVGIGFAAILGVTTVLKTMSSLSGNAKTTGYSAGAYGGKPTSQSLKQS